MNFTDFDSNDVYLSCKNCCQNNNFHKLDMFKNGCHDEYNNIEKIINLLKDDKLEPDIFYMLDDCLSFT
jgi:ferritin